MMGYDEPLPPAPPLEPEYERIAPQSPEAEKSVLSSMLQAPDLAIDEAARLLTKGMFFSPGRQTIFKAILELHAKGKPVDIVSLTQYLGETKELNGVGGAAELAEILTFAPSASYLSYYINILRDKFVLRETIAWSQDTLQEAHDVVPRVEDFLDRVETGVLSIRESLEADRDAQSAREITLEVIEDCERMHNSAEEFGIPSGLVSLDEMIAGWKPGEVAIIAARPSEGKTAFAIHTVEFAALTKGIPCAFFSLEMSRKAIVQRLLSRQTGFSVLDIQSGMKGKSGADFARLSRAAQKVADMPIYIDDTPALSVLSLRSRVRRLKRKHRIKLVAIDYLQLMRSPSKRGVENRQVEVADISGGIKALAKETGLAFVLLAQLNRGPDIQGRAREPRISDLRESGAIEQDADTVAMLARDDGCPNVEELEANGERAMKIIVGKQRNGATGAVKVKFHEQSMLFYPRVI